MSDSSLDRVIHYFSRRYRCTSCGCKGRVAKSARGPYITCARCHTTQPSRLVTIGIDLSRSGNDHSVEVIFIDNVLTSYRILKEEERIALLGG